MKEDTLIVTSGRNPEEQHGFVNPPVYHASTILHETVESGKAARERRWRTGQHGTLPSCSAVSRYLAAFHNEQEKLKREPGRGRKGDKAAEAEAIQLAVWGDFRVSSAGSTEEFLGAVRPLHGRTHDGRLGHFPGGDGRAHHAGLA